MNNEAIIEIRAALGLTQVGFSELLGISVRTLQGLESGRYKPEGATRTLILVAKHFPGTLQKLLKIAE